MYKWAYQLSENYRQ